jgi:hypothetical protein
MRTKSRLNMDTQRLNYRLRQWPITVLDSFDIYPDIVEQALAAKAEIDADDKLAPKGKRAAKDAKIEALVKAISDVKTPRAAGLTADVAAHRSALIPASTQKPTDRQIDFMLSNLKGRTDIEIGVYYQSASDEEKLVLEEASRSVGRIPQKRADGSLHWAPLLPADTVNQSIIDRATDRNPQGAQKLRELEEIASIHEGAANLAAVEIKEILGS